MHMDYNEYSLLFNNQYSMLANNYDICQIITAGGFPILAILYYYQASLRHAFERLSQVQVQ